MEPDNISNHADGPTPGQWPTVQPVVNGLLGIYVTNLFLGWLRSSKETERSDAQHLERLREIQTLQASTPVQLGFSSPIHQETLPLSPGSDLDIPRLEMEIVRLRSEFEARTKAIREDSIENAKVRAAVQEEQLERLLKRQVRFDELEKEAFEAKKEVDDLRAQALQQEQSRGTVRIGEKDTTAEKIAGLRKKHEVELKEREKAVEEAVQLESGRQLEAAREQVRKECKHSFDTKLAEAKALLKKKHDSELDKSQKDVNEAKAALKCQTDVLDKMTASWNELEKRLTDAQAGSAQLESANKSCHNAIAQKYNALSLAETKCLLFEDQLAAASDRESSLTSQLSKAQEELEGYDQKLAEKDEKVSKTHDALNAEQSRRAEAEKSQSHYKSAAEKAQETTVELEHVQTKLESSSQREKALEALLTERDGQLEHVRSRYRNNSDLLTKAADDVRTVRRELRAAKEGEISQKQEIFSLRRQLEDCRKFKAEFVTMPTPQGPSFSPKQAHAATQKTEEKTPAISEAVKRPMPVASVEPVTLEAVKKPSTPLVQLQGSSVVESAPTDRSPPPDKESLEVAIQSKTSVMTTSKWADRDDDDSWSPTAAADEFKAKTASIQVPAPTKSHTSEKLKASASVFVPITAQSTELGDRNTSATPSTQKQAVKSDEVTLKEAIANTKTTNNSETQPIAAPTPPSSSEAPAIPPVSSDSLLLNANEWNPPARPSDLKHYKICHNCSNAFYHPSASHDPENRLHHRAIFRKHIGNCKMQFRTCENEGCGKVMRNDWFYGTHQIECKKATLAKGLKLHNPKALREKQAAKGEENNKKEEARREEKRIMDEKAEKESEAADNADATVVAQSSTAPSLREPSSVLSPTPTGTFTFALPTPTSTFTFAPPTPTTKFTFSPLTPKTNFSFAPPNPTQSSGQESGNVSNPFAILSGALPTAPRAMRPSSTIFDQLSTDTNPFVPTASQKNPSSTTALALAPEPAPAATTKPSSAPLQGTDPLKKPAPGLHKSRYITPSEAASTPTPAIPISTPFKPEAPTPAAATPAVAPTPLPASSTPAPLTATAASSKSLRPKPRFVDPPTEVQEAGILHAIDGNVNADGTVTCICGRCRRTINLPFTKTDGGWYKWNWTKHNAECPEMKKGKKTGNASGGTGITEIAGKAPATSMPNTRDTVPVTTPSTDNATISVKHIVTRKPASAKTEPPKDAKDKVDTKTTKASMYATDQVTPFAEKSEKNLAELIAAEPQVTSQMEDYNCRVCNKTVKIEVDVDPVSGKQVRQIDVHERDCHDYCKICKRIIGNGSLDDKGQFDFTEHNRVAHPHLLHKSRQPNLAKHGIQGDTSSNNLNTVGDSSTSGATIVSHSATKPDSAANPSADTPTMTSLADLASFGAKVHVEGRTTPKPTHDSSRPAGGGLVGRSNPYADRPVQKKDTPVTGTPKTTTASSTSAAPVPASPSTFAPVVPATPVTAVDSRALVNPAAPSPPTSFPSGPVVDPLSSTVTTAPPKSSARSTASEKGKGMMGRSNPYDTKSKGKAAASSSGSTLPPSRQVSTESVWATVPGYNGKKDSEVAKPDSSPKAKK